ncbi:beta-glucosidase 12-like isoform X2 [Rhododendron vialii]|uniref:beta-glucosidase 12-like isoform X2 n=1 Tax=Rhododendron vialii TaxID=182163 RepID=UPI00265E6332|nr:beta-glucosidase 12-like isoform X2 [Rhododendron vialii]
MGRGIKAYLLLCSQLLMSGLSLLVIASAVVLESITSTSEPDDALHINLNRTCFPPHFRWGAASSAYQVEGAANERGKGPSIWDTFTHNHPEKIKDHSNGDLASDSYHRYKEDVQNLKQLNLDAYRFSISWSRLLPRGKIRGGVNEEGITYYNNLINELLANDIEPYVTLFHWDVPQALEDAYGGFLSTNIVDDFRDYAELCFKRFGDRVKYWITMNEPWSFSGGGYVTGAMAPGRCSAWLKLNCLAGDSGIEPYIVTHNQLLAHAIAVNKYRDKYQKSQMGEIGITLVSKWLEPLTNSSLDIEARQRSFDFKLGWFMDPLTIGDYPAIMRSLVGNRLPKFSPKQADMVKGSIDFLGINYYTAQYAANAPYDSSLNLSYDTDSLVTLSSFDQIDDLTRPIPIKEALNDTLRVKYYHDHLSNILEAMKAGVKVEGYFAWSLVDNFEWAFGYSSRFGMYYTDYKDGLKRYPKLSTYWFTSFLNKGPMLV